MVGTEEEARARLAKTGVEANVPGPSGRQGVIHGTEALSGKAPSRLPVGRLLRAARTVWHGAHPCHSAAGFGPAGLGGNTTVMGFWGGVEA